MTNENTSTLAQEWNVLQRQHEEYEQKSLTIKMLATLVVALVLFHQRFDFIIPVILLCLWIQEAIWKTFQARIGERLLKVENALSGNSTETAMQLNSQWLMNRPGIVGLIIEYIKSACRPTVAFPYICYVVLSVWLTLF